jgi:DnaK suppressor protein
MEDLMVMKKTVTKALKSAGKTTSGKAAGKKSAPKPAKAATKPAAAKVVAKKSAPAKKVTPVKKATPAPKSAPIKAATKKVAPPAKKVAPATKVAPAKREKPVKKSPVKAFPAKLQSTTTGDSTTITVTPHEANVGPEPVVEERRLVMTPPPRQVKSSKKSLLKPIKGAPTPLVVQVGEDPWSAAELKAIRIELGKELVRLQKELTEAESDMDELIASAGVGAGDDQADAGTKTFEREHEMSLVYNARDMVLQTERALERIDSRTYGRCEECGNSVGKERLKVFPRATLCMSCKQKEERR